jgi:hypothetical protein
MTLFVRDAENRSLIEFEMVKRDGNLEPSSAFYVINYTRFILKTEFHQMQVADIFDSLSEIRGTYYETHILLNRPPMSRVEMAKWIKEIIEMSGVLQLGTHIVED